MKRLAVLTNIDANHGSCVFNFSLNRILQEALPGYQISFLNYLTPSWYLYEFLRAVKPYKEIPLYNLRRYLGLRRSSYTNLSIEPFFSIFRNEYDDLVRHLARMDYDTLVVGKVVWDIAQIWQTPTFPNIFWLSEKIPAVMIAYAVSGHRTDMELFRQNKDRVLSILSSYALIGVRDDLTGDMMVEAGVDQYVPVMKVPDPAFQFEFRQVDTQALLVKHRIDPERPILGLLYYGKPELSTLICEQYHRKGYQIINFNMYNPYADVNLGHIVDPFEWAALFGTLSFAITDRFHGSIFCIRQNIPFIGIEPYEPISLSNSKVFNLLNDFGLGDCYENTLATDFQIAEFLEKCSQVEAIWETSFSSLLQQKLQEQADTHRKFVALIQEVN